MSVWRLAPYLCQKSMDTRVPPLIEVSSLDEAISKLPEIIDIFNTTGLMVFRGYKFEPKEQLKLVSLVGDELGWNICTARIGPDPDEIKADQYLFHAGGSDNPDRPVGTDADYTLDWHIEQVFYVYPVLAGTWNMYEFTADPTSGHTHFADSIELYNMLSKDDRDFLEKCVVKWDKAIGPVAGWGPYLTKVVDVHPNLHVPLLRVETDGGCIIRPSLHAYDGDAPTQEQTDRYESLYSWLKETLRHDLNIRYVQRWMQDDMVLVDLFRMYHAVTDGFGYGSRKFRGAFLRPTDYDATLFKDMSQIIYKDMDQLR